ncbi:MAG: FAD:protein FMN transferase [Deltaproteobacteria bacterium]|nr:FAD:protein FMN transferase [Deltaproteobacteria bacterium]RLB30792.1 MAG: FAD:protein FMN transferase [Deltaproteobacteria bacterium]
MFKEPYSTAEYQAITRRGFLGLSGVLGLGLAASPIGISLAEAAKFDRHLYKVSRSRPEMGTLTSITVLNYSKDQAYEAIDLAFEEIARLTKLMSRYDVDTPVSQLNRDGYLNGVPPELYFVLRESMRYHEISTGRFDITVKPLIDMYARLSQSSGGISGHEEKIHDLLNLVDARLIVMNESSIAFRKHGMGITLDGIAKGYIVDKAIGVLQTKGIKHALINAGGDIRTLGDKGQNRPWKIAIEDPQKKNDYPDIIAIKNGSVATSGNYEVFYNREKILHHIVNPKTGLSPLMNASLSVQAPTAMEADALSTTLFTLNPIESMRLVQSLPHCEALVVTRNNRKIKSTGWQGIKI